MFVILVYDVNRKRVSLVHKICKKYLYPIQNSVFEGNITQKKLTQLENELQKHIDKDYDSICIYTTNICQNLTKQQIGVYRRMQNIL